MADHRPHRPHRRGVGIGLVFGEVMSVGLRGELGRLIKCLWDVSEFVCVVSPAFGTLCFVPSLRFGILRTASRS
jgi:hypothetical protein